jgi:putative ABC transport system permease protein
MPMMASPARPHGARWIADFFQDLRFCARTWVSRPGFAAVAVLTLALGIGAATAVFSIVDAVLLRPLPYQDPDRLVAIWGRGTRDPNLSKIYLGYRDYEEFRRKARTIEMVSAATWANGLASRTLTGRGAARTILALPVSASLFQTLGVSAALGRTFTSEDEQGGCSVVLAHAFWRTAFGAAANVLGQSVTLNQQSCAVIGVMPATFGFFPRAADAWLLLGPSFVPQRERLDVGIFARLKPGVTREQAQAEVAELHREANPTGFAREIEPTVYDLHGEFTFLASRTLRTTLMVVFAAVSLVLFIACLNVANLLLARLADRQRELAVRAALGSGQGRLARQVLTEALLLSLLGTVLGLGLAYAAIRYFRFASPIELTVGADVTLNLPVLAFSIVLSIATALFFGLLPALRASRIDVLQRLKAAGRGAVRAGTQHRMARAVIVVQMALSFVLLIAGGLLMNSALRMGSEYLGFAPDRVFATEVRLPSSRYGTPGRRLQFYDQLQERLAGLPGVTGVTLGSKLPPMAGGNQEIEIQGRPSDPSTRPHDVGADSVGDGFFDVLGIPVLRGRGFDTRDRRNTDPVIVVNQALAMEYFRDSDPVGQQLRLGDASGNRTPWLTIVGVVGNLKHTELMNEMSWVETPILYRPVAQEPRASFPVERIREEIARLDPDVPLNDVRTLSSRISDTLAYPRFRATIMGLFAISALLLSVVGLHGVLAQLVSQRVPEFGLRRAVGAQTRDLLVLVVRHGGVPVIAGLGIGVASTFAFARFLSKLLYGIQPADPAVMLSVALVLVAAAAAAMAPPAWRAVRIDPMAALRDD